MQQFVGDSAATAFEVTDRSVRQAIVPDHQLGRVDATIRVGSIATPLVATLLAGFLAAWIGLRLTGFLAPLGAVVGAVILWFSPVRMMSGLPGSRPGT